MIVQINGRKRDKSQNNYYFNHYIDELMNITPKQRINYARDLLTKYKYAKNIYSSRLHAFLHCVAIGLNVEYVGDLNYRVYDLINNNPDKSKLNKKFLNYIKNKSMF